MVYSVQRLVDIQEQEVLLNFQGSPLVDSKQAYGHDGTFFGKKVKVH
jgi:hypothetical protein